MSHGKILLIALVVVVGIFAAVGIWNRTQPGEYDGFAQCLADVNIVFYGAYWCPHCQEQKALFGRSADLLPYQECSTADGQGQLALCDEAGITSYPTWVLPDGEMLRGTQDLATLAEKTGCELP